jgi:serine/threonine-protein kinase RsbW
MEKKFKREFGALEDVFGFIDTFVDRSGLNADNAFITRLVVEELFTNLVKYNQMAQHDILIQLDKENGRLTILLMDFEVEPFDTSKIKTVDVGAPLDQREIGQLGIHIVKGLVDKLTYQYSKQERTLCVTAVKNLEATDV